MVIPTAIHCRGITWWAHRDDDRSAEVRASALSKTPIGSVDPYALKIPARRAECLFTTPRQSVSTHRHRAFAVWLPPPAKVAPSPAAANSTYRRTSASISSSFQGASATR